MVSAVPSYDNWVESIWYIDWECEPRCKVYWVIKGIYDLIYSKLKKKITK